MKQQSIYKLTILLLVLAIPSVAFINKESQEEKKGEARKAFFLGQWETAKVYTLELIDAMPEDAFDHMPQGADGVRTYAQQFKHLGAVALGMNSIFIKDEAPMPPDPNIEKTGLSKAEVKVFVTSAFDTVSETVKGMTDKQLTEKREMIYMPGEPSFTKYQYLDFIRDHCAHQRGQVLVYLRSRGISPPAYKYFPM